MFLIQKKEIQLLLNNYTTEYEDEKGHHEKTTEFVELNDNIFGRDNLLGHITASAWVLSPDSSSILLIHHKKIGKWFQPGGHVEKEDDTIQLASLREAKEETGITALELLDENLFDIDVHLIGERGNVPAHWHYDFRFQMKALSWDINGNEEVKDIKWTRIKDALDSEESFGSIRRMLKKSRGAW